MRMEYKNTEMNPVPNTPMMVAVIACMILFLYPFR